jgi:hypothetical protein
MPHKLKVFVVVLFASAIIPASSAMAAASPAATTRAVGKVNLHNAVLRATVNPEGAATTYYFQWGPTTAYGSTVPAQHLGPRARNVIVRAAVHGLVPGTVYHYRVIASNALGQTFGTDVAFKTAGVAPADAVTGIATSVVASSATANGTISPNGAATTWAFQYGSTTAYGEQTPGIALPAGSGPVPVSAPLALTPGTIFHYRLIAIHPGNVVSYGADASWMTFPAKPERATMSVRTTPAHNTHKPFTLTTTGRLVPPASIPSLYSCSGGQATIRYVRRNHDINSRLVNILPNCTFSTRVTLHPKLGDKQHHDARAAIRINIHFFGNGYLAPANARPENFMLG